MLFGLYLSFQCGIVFAARPYSPFVERVVTQERSRQLKVALHEKLWVLYDLPQCQLYQAWPGGTSGGILENAHYTFFDQAPHFPHWFVASGNPYFKDSVGEYFASWTKPADIVTYYTKWPQQPRNYKAWTVQNGGATVESQTRFKGYFVNGDVFKIGFALILGDGREIGVLETPEYIAVGLKTTLVRKLVFTGLPAGFSASLSLPAGGNWAVTGTGSLLGKNLLQAVNGESILTGSW